MLADSGTEAAQPDETWCQGEELPNANKAPRRGRPLVRANG